MPRLPRKPDVPPIVVQSLVVGALSMDCTPVQVRIGQPPDAIPAPCDLLVLDEAGEAIVGARVELADGGVIETDSEGRVTTNFGKVRVVHPDYGEMSAYICDDYRVVLPDEAPVGAVPVEVDPVRIGAPPDLDERATQLPEKPDAN